MEERQILTSSPEEIYKALSEQGTKPNRALECCINSERTKGRGYLVGLVEENKGGYWPTNVIVTEADHNKALAIVMQANLLIWPERTQIETVKLIASSYILKT